MKPALAIVLRSFVKSFYRENAGLFVFFMVITVGAVGQLNGAGLMAYHYSLMMGMLTNKIFFSLVLLLWLGYARKCMAFVIETMGEPGFSFLYILKLLGRKNCFVLLLIVQVLLYLPVLIYASLMTGVAWFHHWWMSAAILVFFGLAVCCWGALSSVRKLYDPGKEYFSRNALLAIWKRGRTSYVVILLRYILHDLKMILVGIKCFTCGVLYLIALNNTVADYDLQFPFLFFGFGIFAHAIIIYRVRHFEETQLNIYRGLPVPLIIRFLQYAWMYFLLFVPEIATIVLLMPVHLRPVDAMNCMLAGYSLLLLLNSLSYADSFSMKDYLKVSLLIYGVLYLFVATLFFQGLYILFFSLAVLIFFLGYYRYEHAR